MLYSVAGVTDSFSSYESYYMSGTSDTEYSSESGSVEAVGSYYQYDVSITYCFVTLYVHLKQPTQLIEMYHASLVVPFLRTISKIVLVTVVQPSGTSNLTEANSLKN